MTLLTEQFDEQKQNLAKITTERDVLKNDIRTLTETNEKQTTENGRKIRNNSNQFAIFSFSEQTIRRLQDELDNTTQLLESIRSKGRSSRKTKS